MQHTAAGPTTRPSWSRIGPWRPPHVDALIAAAFLVLTLAEAMVSPMVRSPVMHVLVAGAAMVFLAWRRRFPLPVTIVAVASNLVINSQEQFSTLLALVLVAYTVGSETDPPSNYVGLAVLVVPFVTASVVAGLEPSDLAAALVFFVGPWVGGGAVRQRATRTAEALDRADRLEREQARAIETERTRIARELHDIVSHSISVVTIQTQAVRRRLGPEHAREAADLAAIEATARQAMAEMRRLFGVLRSDGQSAALAPQPGLSELDRLVAQAQSSGLPVELRRQGTPCDLSPGIDLAAYRIVQEALTNALRHAAASKATVNIAYGRTSLHLTVEDDGHGLRGGSPGSGGHGLVGIRERVALYGGTVELGVSDAGGVRLSASLPVGGFS